MFLLPVWLLSLQGRYRKTADFLKRLRNCADCVSTLRDDFDFDLGLVPERSASFLFSHSFVYLFIYSIFFFSSCNAKHLPATSEHTGSLPLCSIVSLEIQLFPPRRQNSLTPMGEVEGGVGRICCEHSEV